MVFGNDISEQYNSPLTLLPKEELQFAKFLISHIADADFWLGKDARFLYVNERTCCELGYSNEELLSLRVYDVVTDLSLENW